MQLSGRKAIVTGASRGIGKAIAQTFLEEGADVIAVSRTSPDDSTWSCYSQLTWCPADLSNAGAVATLFRAAQDRWGTVDILVNNAGAQLAKPIDETSEDEFDLLTGVNMKAVFLCCRQAIPWMRDSGGGSIINIGSSAGIVPDFGMPLYSASKAWVHGFSRAIAIEHGRDGIRCNSLAPSWTRTDMSIELFQAEANPAFAEHAVNRRHPLGRMAEPADIAAAALWLASPASAFISGQVVSVDGGIGAASQINPEWDFAPR